MTTFFRSNGQDLESFFIKKEIFNDGSLWVWGQNIYNNFGATLPSSVSSPVQTTAGGITWRQASANFGETNAVKTDGSLWTWGDNSLTITGNDWRQISCGSAHNGALKNDGTLWMWGTSNTYGQIGDNTTVAKTSPVQTVAGGNSWRFINCSDDNSLAIKTDGSLWVWGRTGVYNLFTTEIANVNYSSPVQYGVGTNDWKTISCFDTHICAIKTDGTLWVWGNNGSGQLGVNDRVHRTSPVQTTPGGTDWRQVSAGSASTAAIKTNGTLWTWGANGIGQLADGTTTNKSSPVQTIAGGTNWKQVSSGFGFVGAIKTDGTLWMWGENEWGKLGTNDLVHRSSPVQTVAGGTNWRQVALGDDHVVAIRA